MHGKYTGARTCSKLSVACVFLFCFVGEWFVYHVSCHPRPVAAIFFNTFLVLAAWSYLATAFTNPGTAEASEWEVCMASKPAAPQDDTPSSVRRRGWQPGVLTWCKTCGRNRPERAHHCVICGICVMRMDHHCPWIGNCVGWGNHKYFVLMNFYSFIACVTLLGTMQNPSAGEALVAILDPESPTVGNASLIPWMGCRNVTAVEEMFLGENPYMAPSSWVNLKQIMGELEWKILVPLPPVRKPNSQATIYQGELAGSCGNAVSTSYGATV